MYEAQLVGEVVAGEAAKVRKQLEKIIADVTKSSFDIGTLAHTVKSKGYYSEWGFTTFQEYAATLPIKIRKLQYLARIAFVMEAVGISRDAYEPAGVAKLREITSLDPNGVWVNPETSESTPLAEFIKGFVEKSADMSLEDIKAHVRTLKGILPEDDFVFLNLSIKRSALENTVRPALELAKNAIGSVYKDDEGVSHDASDGAALEYMAADFSSDPANNILSEEQ